jgi:hypothetical protein
MTDLCRCVNTKSDWVVYRPRCVGAGLDHGLRFCAVVGGSSIVDLAARCRAGWLFSSLRLLGRSGLRGGSAGLPQACPCRAAPSPARWSTLLSESQCLRQAPRATQLRTASVSRRPRTPVLCRLVRDPVACQPNLTVACCSSTKVGATSADFPLTVGDRARATRRRGSDGLGRGPQHRWSGGTRQKGERQLRQAERLSHLSRVDIFAGQGTCWNDEPLGRRFVSMAQRAPFAGGCARYSA